MPFSLLRWLLPLLVLQCCALISASREQTRYLMYLTGQHNVIPEPRLVPDITHVTLAFMRSELFNEQGRTTWPLFTTVEEVRAKFPSGTVIQIAVGGWGNSEGFEIAAKTEESRSLFASNVKAMLDVIGADGIDIDWEYPGGNGEDYKTHPNSEKYWQVTEYPNLLQAIRTAIGSTKILSAAVPGLPRDMIAFTEATVPQIMDSVDFLNVMTYDLMNRRDNVTKHHTGREATRVAIDAYTQRGARPEKLNLGLGYYLKWFKTAKGVDCSVAPVGCKTELMEDPKTGADLGQAGAFSWHDEVPSELNTSFHRALEDWKYDDVEGGNYYWDKEERVFWSWEAPEAIWDKVRPILRDNLVNGVFAWGLGEDAPNFHLLKATNSALWGFLDVRKPDQDEHTEL